MDLTHIYERQVDPEGQDSLARISRLVRPGSTVLELGPATGYFTRHLRESLGCTVDCIEYSPEMAEMARPFARNMVVGDLDRIDPGEKFEPAAYDHIIAADVLEHLKNPWRVLSGCRSLLNPNGTALLSIPHIGHAALVAELMAGRFEYRDEGLLDRTHLRFFTRASIIDLLRRTGFRPQSIHRIEWMAETTEFKRILENMPPKLRGYLLAHGDALTYQFIVEASPGDMSDDDVDEAIAAGGGPAEPYFLAKMYWTPEGTHLTEERCISRPVPLRSEPAIVRFDLPANERVAYLRFDPADRPGFMQLHRIRIIELAPNDSEVTCHLDCVNPTSIQDAFEFREMLMIATALGSSHVAITDDPKLFHTADPPYRPAPGNRLSLEVDMTWPVSADYVTAEGIYRNQLTELQSRLSLAEARLGDYSESIRPLRNRINELTRERDEINMFEPMFIQQEARTRELERVLAEIYGSRAWKFIMRWRRLKERFRR